MFLGAAVATAVVARASDAGATISGIVSIPSYVCSGQTGLGRAYCPFFSISTGYTGSNVGTLYVDAHLYANSGLEAKACEQSYSTGSFYCGSYGTTTGSNINVDLPVPGFSSIPGAPKSPWDYYIVYMDNYIGGTFDLLGVGYL
jgi:hypothetical protein